MEEHPQARYIIDTLAKAGFVAYYAGGWVRDFLLGHPSDDIDIATNAPPETIQVLFPRTVPIGIAFGIILVIVDGHQYEVATFRNDLDYKDGRRPTRVEFTTAVEDAKRRDFTINGMFYDPLKGEILDFVGGREDLDRKVIRAIGNPHERIKEDRLRMIRGVRLACRFHFAIDPDTAKAIRTHAKELFPAVAIERIVQEFEKGHAFGKLRPMLIQLHEFELLQTIFPDLKEELNLEAAGQYPHNAPLIAFLLQLFPDYTLRDQLHLCKILKLPNHDAQFTTFLFRAKELLIRPVELIEWAYFYADRFSTITLQILAAHQKNKEAFLQEHEQRIALLQSSIQRIHAHDPVVKSDDLIKIGVEPGKQMGQLLKEAERIAINEQIYDKEQILNRIYDQNL